MVTSSSSVVWTSAALLMVLHPTQLSAALLALPQLLLLLLHQHQLQHQHQLLLLITPITVLLLALMTRSRVSSRAEASCALLLAMPQAPALQTSLKACPTLSHSASCRTRTLVTSTAVSHAVFSEVTAHRQPRAPLLSWACACTLMARQSMPAPSP